MQIPLLVADVYNLRLDEVLREDAPLGLLADELYGTGGGAFPPDPWEVSGELMLECWEGLWLVGLVGAADGHELLLLVSWAFGLVAMLPSLLHSAPALRPILYGRQPASTYPCPPTLTPNRRGRPIPAAAPAV